MRLSRLIDEAVRPAKPARKPRAKAQTPDADGRQSGRRPAARQAGGLSRPRRPSPAASACSAARKAGHTGTLDPFATGLLPLVFGEATKFSRFLIDATKTYRATLRLGVETSTGDPEGVVTVARDVNASSEKIDEVLGSFLGFRDQIPPMHSAVHVGGRRLYELAREGVEVERAPRRVEIRELSRVSLEGPELVVDVTCSKGTYMRTLAAEIGDGPGLRCLPRRRCGAPPSEVSTSRTRSPWKRSRQRA